MSKSILVIDMPKSCGECKLCYKDGDSWFDYRCTVSEDKVEYESIYENCPLKPLPQRKQKRTEFPQYSKEYEAYCIGDIDGWNYCLDEILGGNDE